MKSNKTVFLLLIVLISIIITGCTEEVSGVPVISNDVNGNLSLQQEESNTELETNNGEEALEEKANLNKIKEEFNDLFTKVDNCEMEYEELVQRMDELNNYQEVIEKTTECETGVNNFNLFVQENEEILKEIDEYSYNEMLSGVDIVISELIEMRDTLSLSDTKYDFSDIEEVKTLAEDCKFDINICAEDYKADIIPVEIVSSIMGEEYYVDNEMTIWVWTPFFKAVKEIADKEKNYEEYTDKEIINYLQEDYIHIYLTYGNIMAYKLKNLGAYENMVIKYGSKVYHSEKSDYSTYDSSIKIKKIGSYNNFYDKKVILVVVGETGEKEIEIDMTRFK